MNVLIKTLALTIILAALGFAGFYAGQYFKHAGIPDPAAIVADLPSFIEPEDNRIHAINPSVGPFPRTIMLEKITGDADGFHISLAAEDAEEIQQGQDVVFYSLVDGKIYPVLGSVHSVEDDGDQKKITLTAPQNFLDLKPAVEAQIILAETVSKRLPLEALMQDESGDYYVWRALPDQDGTHKIVHQKITIGLIGDDYFEAGPEIQVSDFIVANPPANFENGQTSTLVVSVLDAPVHSLIEQVRVREFEDKAAKAKAELEMWQALTNTVPQPGGGCGAPLGAKGLPAPIESNSGTIAGAAPSGASAGCSSCSTPAAPVTTDAAAPAAAPSAPAPSGGCNSCGSSTYGGAPPVPMDNPAVTQ